MQGGRRDESVCPQQHAVTCKLGQEYESPCDAVLFLGGKRGLQMGLLTCASERLTRQCRITMVTTEHYHNIGVIIWHYVSKMLSSLLLLHYSSWKPHSTSSKNINIKYLWRFIPNERHFINIIILHLKRFVANIMSSFRLSYKNLQNLIDLKCTNMWQYTDNHTLSPCRKVCKVQFTAEIILNVPCE